MSLLAFDSIDKIIYKEFLIHQLIKVFNFLVTYLLNLFIKNMTREIRLYMVSYKYVFQFYESSFFFRNTLTKI